MKDTHIVFEYMKGLGIHAIYTPGSTTLKVASRESSLDPTDIMEETLDYIRHGIGIIHKFLVSTEVIDETDSIGLSGYVGGGDFYGKFDKDCGLHSRPFMYFPYEIFMYHSVFVCKGKETEFLDFDAVCKIPETFLRRLPIVGSCTEDSFSNIAKMIHPTKIHKTMLLRKPPKEADVQRMYGLLAIPMEVGHARSLSYVYESDVCIGKELNSKNVDVDDLLSGIDDMEDIDAIPDEMLYL